MTLTTNIPAAPSALSGEQIKAIQHQMKLSDEQFLEALGQAGPSAERRLRRWKAGDELPRNSTLVALKLLFAIDRALAHIDNGEIWHATDALRNVLPDFMQ